VNFLKDLRKGHRIFLSGLIESLSEANEILSIVATARKTAKTHK
jgi:hypothetical protein